MMCVLRAAGKDFDVDKYLESSKLSPCSVYKKGEPKFSNKPGGPFWDYSVMNIGISDHDFSNVEGQVIDAIRFLGTNMFELTNLLSHDGVDSVCIDFPVENKNEFCQSILMPSELLLKLGGLNIDLEITLYPKTSCD